MRYDITAQMDMLEIRSKNLYEEAEAP